jgi:RNA polymerase sigma-70 factor (ECF subfamily)
MTVVTVVGLFLQGAGMEQRTDIELIARFQKGDQAAFEELISRYSAKAFGLALRLVKNEEDAEEVLQDVFVTVYRKIDGFEGKSSFSSWLYRVTVNAAFMKLRKKRQDKTVALEEVLAQVAETPIMHSPRATEGDCAAERAKVTRALEEAIGNLPEEYRPVFVLRDVDGLTSKEVGKILNISIPAVKSRLHRSRLLVRKTLCNFYDEYRTGVAVGARAA